MMKSIILFLALLCASFSPVAAEVTEFSSSKWDIRALPAGLRAFHFEVNDALECKSVQVELDLYRAGTKVETIRSKPLTHQGRSSVLKNFKASILMQHGKPDAQSAFVSIGTEWNGIVSLQGKALPHANALVELSTVSQQFRGQKIALGRTPIFYIMLMGESGYSAFMPEHSPEELVKAYPTALILIGYLVVE